jgi:hypothetical protein
VSEKGFKTMKCAWLEDLQMSDEKRNGPPNMEPERSEMQFQEGGEEKVQGIATFDVCCL